MEEAALDRLDRKIDQLLERTKTVETDHAEIARLRDRMHKVEGAQSIFKTILDEFKGVREAVKAMDERLEAVEADQITAKAVQEALERHQQKVSQQGDKRERRIFAVLGLLASLGVINFLTNLIQNSP